MTKQKENSHEGITWSELGKQNVEAKEVYCFAFETLKNAICCCCCHCRNLTLNFWKAPNLPTLRSRVSTNDWTKNNTITETITMEVFTRSTLSLMKYWKKRKKKKENGFHWPVLCFRHSGPTIGGLRNLDDDGNKNPTNLHIWQW